MLLAGYTFSSVSLFTNTEPWTKHENVGFFLTMNLNVKELSQRTVLCVPKISQGETHKASQYDKRHQKSETKTAKVVLACRLPRKCNIVISLILNKRAETGTSMFPCCSGVHYGEYWAHFVLFLQHYLHLLWCLSCSYGIHSWKGLNIPTREHKL